MKIDEVFLGEVDYNGELAKAIREVYDNGEWKFIIQTQDRRIELMTY